MPRLTQLHSFLDRFEERIQVDCEQLKRQLVAQVDEQFGSVRAKVAELRNRFGGYRVLTSRSETLINDPLVVTVQLDQWKQEQRALVDSSALDAPSTSTGPKRKSSTTSGTNRNKRQRTVTTDGKNKNQCKSPGCGKSFRDAHDLARHERIHLGIKPFINAFSKYY